MRKYIEKKESNLRDVYGWVLATVEIVCVWDVSAGLWMVLSGQNWGMESFQQKKNSYNYQQNWIVDLTKIINSKHIISAPMGLRASHFGPYPWLATHSKASHSPISSPTDGPISQFQAMALCCPNTGRRPPPGRECRTTTKGRATNACLLPIRVASEGRTLKARQKKQIADLAPYPISYW